MAETSGAKKPTASGLEDRISTLPDRVLEHVIGFLPADNAVRTSVLARRWRYLWRSMRRLRLDVLDCDRRSPPAFGNFMDGLLLLRNPAVALDVVKFCGSRNLSGDDDLVAYHSICIQHLLFCQTKFLAIDHTPCWMVASCSRSICENWCS